MLNSGKFEARAEKLVIPQLSPDARLQLIIEVRDSIEIVHSGEYAQFAKFLIPAFQTILTQLTRPQLVENSINKTRHVILEILNRLPHNDVFKPYVPQILKLTMDLLKEENEDNVVLCLKIVFDIQKNYRMQQIPTIEAQVQPLLEFVRYIYDQFPATAQKHFPVNASQPNAGALQAASVNSSNKIIQRPNNSGLLTSGGIVTAPSAPALASTPKANDEKLILGINSFKVVVDCPLIVMFLIQVYPRYGQKYIPLLLPSMVKAIEVKVPGNVIKDRSYYNFIASQVKTVSFLSYLLKQHQDSMKEYENAIPKAVVQLLLSCPGDAVVIRKEVLVATRHILATDFRKGFFNEIDLLLHEKVLVGTGRLAYETLRPLAYSFLAEFVHYIRMQLSLPQLSRIIHLYSTNVHDSSLHFAMQTTSVRLLLNLVEPIIQNTDSESKRRQFLIRIMEVICTKFSSIKDQVPRLRKAAIEAIESQKSAVAPFSELTSNDPLKEINEYKQLIKTLTLGLKTVVWGAGSLRAEFPNMVGQGIQIQQPGAQNTGSTGFTSVPRKGLFEEECVMLVQLLSSAPKCFQIHHPLEETPTTEPKPPLSAQLSSALMARSEEKEIFDQLTQVYTMLDPRNFQGVFGTRIGQLVDLILKNPNAISLPQHFLSNSTSNTNVLGKYFADILLTYLIGELKHLEFSDNRSAVYLQLFKLVFSFVNRNTENETVLRPYIAPIVQQVISMASVVEDPGNCLNLLKMLFKSLSGGKFELLYKEFIPLLHPLLEGLLKLFYGPHHLKQKDLLIELSLTLPARPSTILPHLGLQMHPILASLNSSRELVSLGLRTLEFWVDTLQTDFLCSLLDPVEPEMTLGLWKHARPAPNAFGQTAGRIIGKLGGKSRRLMSNIHKPDYKTYGGKIEGILNMFTGDGSRTIDDNTRMNASDIVNPLLQIVFGNNETVHVEKALNILISVLFLFLQLPGTDSMETNPLDKLEKCDLMQTDAINNIHQKLKLSSSASFFGQSSLVQSILEAILSFRTNKNLKINDIAKSICIHFAFLDASHQNISSAKNATQEGRSSVEDKTQLKSIIFQDALLECISSENPEYSNGGIESVCDYLNALLKISSKTVYKSTTNTLLERFNHACYKRKWNEKLGGIKGLRETVKLLPADIFHEKVIGSYEPNLIHALLFTFRDIPADEVIPSMKNACRETLESLIEKCHKNSETDNEKPEFLRDVTMSVCGEFTSSVIFVRELAQDLLQKISLCSGIETKVLVETVQDHLLAQCSHSPLRSLPFLSQEGIISAITYFIELNNELFKKEVIEGQLKPILVSVLDILEDSTIGRLVEAEESTINKLIENKLVEAKTAEQLVSLRYHSIKFVCACLKVLPELKLPVHRDMHSRIISTFFRSLESRNNNIIEVAKQGLSYVIEHHALTKEILQNNLRPIVSNLSDHKKLTGPCLKGLARVLELLSNWFNVSLGEKLLEHLRKWLEPEKLMQSTKGWPAGTECRVAAGIIELFHLLPPAASKFLEPLTDTVIRLESLLGIAVPGQGHVGNNGEGSASTSPYRDPLLKFCTVHATVAVDFYLSRLSQPAFRHLFFILLRVPDGHVLRQEIASKPQKLLNMTFKANPSNDGSGMGALLFWGISIVNIISEFDPEWLPKNKEIFLNLVKIWNSSARKERLTKEESLPIEQLRESWLLAKCILRYCEYHHKEVDILFDLLSIFSVRTLSDFSFVKMYYSEYLPANYSSQEKKLIFKRFMQVFKDENQHQEYKIHALQLLVLPMLEHSFKEGKGMEVLDDALISEIVQDLLDQPEENLKKYDDALSAELLKLATYLIQYLPGQLTKFRKELIKFGWNHLKREDSIAKQWAFVNVCRFFEAYLAPDKIILQVYVALLRAYQPEGKAYVKQALDILVPALPKRLPHNKQEHKYPIWIRYTKKILVEEGHSLPNSTHIWQSFVRHKNLFYNARAQFVSQMVSSLTRMGVGSNSSSENRRLAVDLAELILEWETRRREEKAKKLITNGTEETSESPQPYTTSQENGSQKDSALGKRPRSINGNDDEELPSSKALKTNDSDSIDISKALETETDKSNDKAEEQSQPAEDDFKPTNPMIEMVLNFLARVAFTVADVRERALFTKKSLILLKMGLELWPEGVIRLNYLEKIMETIPVNFSLDPQGKGNNNPTKADPQSGQRGEKLDIAAVEKNLINESTVTTALELCILLVNQQKENFAESNSGALRSIVLPSFDSSDPTISKLFLSLLESLQTIFPASNDSGTKSGMEVFFNVLDDCVKEGLRSSNRVHVINGLKVLNIRDTAKNYDEQLIKLLEKFVKDFIMSQTNFRNKAGEIPDNKDINKSSEELPYAIITIVSLLCKTLTPLSEHRRRVFQSIWTIIEKSNASDLIYDLIEIAATWIESENEDLSPCLSSKEKVQFLLKMNAVERIKVTGNKKPVTAYLNLVYRLFSNEKSATNSDFLSKLERPFAIGLRATDSALREKFFELFQKRSEPTVYSRLKYIFQDRYWEYMADSMWITQATDLLLRCVNTEVPIKLGPSGIRFPSINRLGDVFPCLSEGTESEEFTVERNLLKNVEYRTSSFVSSLCELLYINGDFAHNIWVAFFPGTWKLLNQDAQSELLVSLSNLLCKEHLVTQIGWKRNVVQSLVEGLAKADHLSALSTPLMVHLAQRWNCWNTVIDELSEKVFPVELNKKYIELSANEKEECKEGIISLYRQLNENSICHGIWYGTSSSESTKIGICYEQQGAWQLAQDTYYDAFMEYGTEAGRFENCFWEDRWIASAKQLCQWEELTEFSRTVMNIDLLQDSLLRVPDWAALKDSMTKHPISDSSKLRLFQGYLQTMESKFDNIDAIAAQGLQKIFEQWNQLPSQSDTNCIHPLQERLQQFVELMESGRLLSDVKAIASGQNEMDQNHVDSIRQILAIWRERLPSDNDDILSWNNIMIWRKHIYTSIANSFYSMKESGREVPPILLCLGINESAWLTNQFAKVCRKRNMPDVALTSLTKLHNYYSLDAADFYHHIKEELKSCLMSPWSIENAAQFGLQRLSSCNMEHFSPMHKATLFALQGDLHRSLGDSGEANKSYSLAISSANDSSTAWLKWGHHCDRIHVENEEENNWGEAAVMCYFEAIRFGSKKARLYLARNLRLLSIEADKLSHQGEAGNQQTVEPDPNLATGADNETPNRASKSIASSENKGIREIFDTFLDVLPPWVWLPWIQQLIPMLSRPEAVAARDIMVRLAISYPQSVFFPLRAFLEERKVIDRPSRGYTIDALNAVTPVFQPLLPNAAAQVSAQAHAQQLNAANMNASTLKQKANQLAAISVKAQQEAQKCIGTPQAPAAIKHAQQAQAAAIFAQKEYQEALKKIQALNQRQHQQMQQDPWRQIGMHPVAPNQGPSIRPGTGPPVQNTALRKSEQSSAMKASQSIPILHQKQPMKPNPTNAAGTVGNIQQPLHNDPNANKPKLEPAFRKGPASSNFPNPMGNGETSKTVSVPAPVPLQNEIGKLGEVKNSPATGKKLVASPRSQVQRQADKAAAIKTGPGNAPLTNKADVKIEAVKTTAPPGLGVEAGKPKGTPSMSTIPSTDLEASKIAPPGINAGPNKKGSSISQLNSSGVSTPYENGDIIMSWLVKLHQMLYIDMEKIAQELAVRMKPQPEEQLLGLMNALLHRCYQIPPQAGKEVSPSLRSALEEVSKMCFGTSVTRNQGGLAFKIAPTIADLKAAFEEELAPQTAKDFPTDIDLFISRLRRWKIILQKRVERMPSFQKLEMLSRYLLDLKDSPVEVFGQHFDQDGEPNKDLNAKICRLDSDVKIMKRHSGASRRIHVLGNDGKSYYFLLETSVNATCQRTEERSAQICRIINKLLAKDHVCRRKRLKIEANLLIPTGQHTRLVSDDPSGITLSEIFEEHESQLGREIDDSLISFRKKCSNDLDQNVEKSEGTNKEQYAKARFSAYRHVTENEVPGTVLYEWSKNSFPDVDHLFLFRKGLAKNMGVSSLFVYLFAVGARRPQNLILSRSNCCVNHAYSRPNISNRGLLEVEEAVPFRLTRNLQKMLTEKMVNGVVRGSMYSMMRCLLQNFDLFINLVSVILRDEFIIWTSNLPDLAKRHQSLNNHTPMFNLLEDRLKESSRMIAKRLNYIADGIVEKNVYEKIEDLLKVAQNEYALSLMDPSWYSWF